MVVSGWQLDAVGRFAPRPELRVAIAVLHAQQGADFFGDTAEARTVAALRSLGIGADLLHVHYPRGDAAAATALNDQVLQWCGEHAVNVVVAGQLWDEDLLARWHAAGCLVVGTDAYGQWRQHCPAVLIAHFPQHRAPLLQVLTALRHGDSLLQLPNVAVADAATSGYTASTAEPQPYASTDELRLPFAAATDAVVFGDPRNQDGSLPAVRKTLDTNSGCPFADDAAANEHYAGIELGDRQIAHKGCAFCFMGGDYRALPVAQTVAAHLAQISFWQAQLPCDAAGRSVLQELVVRDQAALRYLPELIEAGKSAGLQAVGLLVPGRGDSILRYGSQLRQAAQACGDSGWWFTIHLIGFESFSQPQLDLYNKGVTVGEYAEALRQMRALHREFPQAFRLYAYGASSFILFNPWTTLADLEATAQFCDDNAVGDLAHGLTLSRLRLYPNLPVYWKAKHDGLLVDEPPAADRGAAFAGYAAEATWRYRDPRLQVVETLHRLLVEHVPPNEGVGLLRTVVRWARAVLPEGGEVADLPTALQLQTIVQQFRQLRQLWQRDQPADLQFAARRVNQQRTVIAGRTCNNRCRTCTAGHAQFLDRHDSVRAAVQTAAATGQVVFAGREPTLLPHLLAHVRLAAKAGATRIEALTNGRALSTPGAVEHLQRAGLTGLAVKRHRLHDGDEDEITRSPGSGIQNRKAIAQLRVAALHWTLHWLVVAEGVAELPDVPAWAKAHGARTLVVQVLAGEMELANLFSWRAGLEQLVAAAERVGLPVQLQGA